MAALFSGKAHAVKESITNFSLRVPREESSIAPPDVVTNIDTDPATPAQRTWGYGIWALYWTSDIVVISGWQKISAAVALGLDWKNALGCVVLGSLILTFPLCLNGRMGASNRIPFPICIRASHGYHLAKFPVISRGVTASFWFAIQGWNGATCVRLMIGAIWPSFLTMASHVPASQGFTAQTMISYLVFWAIQFPLLFIHPTKLRPVFAVKFVAVPVCAFAILGWSVAQAKAVTGGSLGTVLSAPPTATGSTFAYAWLTSLTALISGFATLSLNIPDFSRYSKGVNTPLVQAPLVPVIYTLLGICAAVSASCTQAITGTALWSPVDIIALWDNRAAVFFGASAWMLAQMAQNLSANSVSAANDLATLFPKYLNIRRAQVLIAFVAGWGLVPWKILKSATSFYSFVSGYAIVLGPFAGIMLSDYYIIKKQKLDVPALYDPNGRYRFNSFGVNWRAAVALLFGITPNIPGVVHAVNSKIDIGNAKWIYSVSWLYGFVSASIVYLAVSLLFPDKTGSIVDFAVHPDEYWASLSRETNPPVNEFDEKESQVSEPKVVAVN